MWPVVNFEHSQCDVYIGRPSKWGCPYMIGVDGSREEVLLMYESWLLSRPEFIAEACRELEGKVLGCWCYPQRCHGDILARIVNGWQLPVPLHLEE